MNYLDVFFFFLRLTKVSPVSATRFDSKFVNMVSKLTRNHGVDYVVLSKHVSNRLPELLADDAKIIITENTNVSVLSSKTHETYTCIVEVFSSILISTVLGGGFTEGGSMGSRLGLPYIGF